ncbi:uncharacterized protein LODBEIA_P15980 [Lodderomyces beijingensis]|uniref:Flavodoxin-like domain-containing protein n=1 Tax=Lodderomyces beijingensis TaxID=1775926 RepID=A0ABP0ZGT3_9ASCO
MKIAIIYYSTYGHVTTLAKAVQEGVAKAGYKADLFQIPETLPQDVLDKMHAPPKPTDIPIATLDTLTSYDAFVFGIPTRFGTGPAQFFDFWGSTGGLWAQGALAGKPAAVFVSTGTQGGGQETTVRNTLSWLVHHGLIYVPLGYANAFALQANLDEVHGGSPYGAGAFAGGDGSRQPSKLELDVAEIQGSSFAKIAAKLVGGGKAVSAEDKKAGAGAGAATTNAAGKAAPAADKSKSEAAEKPTKAAAAPQRAKQSVAQPDSADKSMCSKCTIM